MNWGCPFCKSNIMDKNTSLKFGQMVKCPSKQCGKVYSFIRCSKCEKLIFSRDNENILGMAVKCPHQGCGAYTLVCHCPKCDTKAIYSDIRTNYKEGDLIQCPNPTCGKEYPFEKNQEIYKDNLQILEQIEGEVINFGIAQVDENFSYKEDLFFDKRTVRNHILFPTQYSGSRSTLGRLSMANSQQCEWDTIPRTREFHWRQTYFHSYFILRHYQSYPACIASPVYPSIIGCI